MALKDWSISYTTGVISSNGSIVGWGDSYTNPGTATNPVYSQLQNNKTAKSVCFGNSSVISVCTDGSVQVIGYNPNGQLGTGNSTTVPTFTTVSLNNNKLAKKIRTSYGLNLSVIVCTDGTVQYSGDGALIGDATTNVFKPVVSLSSLSVADIVLLANGYVVLTTDNKIYANGAFYDGTVKHGFQLSGLTQLTVPGGSTPKHIIGSHGRCYVLCTNGKVYVYGTSVVNYNLDRYGGWTSQINAVCSTLTLMPTPSNKTIKWIGAGIDYAIIITTDNLVYATGGNLYGQLGINSTTRSDVWTQVTQLKSGRIPIAVECSSNYASIIIYDDGTIQATGNNSNKYLGDGTTTQRNVFTDIMQISGQTIYSTTVTGFDTAPDAPTSVSGTSGNGQAIITFTPPANNGGATITSYTVTASPGGATASGASSPLTVTGLTNGTAYTFTVTATNSVGTGSASSASAPVTPAVAVSDLNSGNISKLTNETVIAGGRSITAKKLTKSAGAVSYAPDAANKPSVAISNIPATVQDVTVGVASSDASGIAVVKIVAQDASNNLITDFSTSPLTVRVTLPGFTVAMVTIQTSATIGGAVTDTITGYRIGTNLYEFTTTHLTYFSASAYVPCLVTGTRVLTAGGYKAVEELKAGDLIRTADNRIVPFRLFTTTISTTSPETAPYTIPANTFGASPASNLTVSPYHAIQSAPGVWQIPKYASRLFEGITQAPAGQPITYYHLELPNYFKDNLVVEGTVTESYGNKQTAGMKTVYKFNPSLNGFVRMEKTLSAKKSMH